MGQQGPERDPGKEDLAIAKRLSSIDDKMSFKKGTKWPRAEPAEIVPAEAEVQEAFMDRMVNKVLMKNKRLAEKLLPRVGCG